MEHTQSELSLPKFLQPSLQPHLPTQTPRPVPLHAVYSHEQPFGISQVLWWPWRSLDGSVTPRTVLLFIPGDPGLLDFYVPFLDTIHNEANTSKSSSVTIFAHAHLGLSSFIGGDRSFPTTSSVALSAQVQAHLEFLDELLAAYGPETSVLLVGHSIGSWLVQEMLKARATALQPHPRVGAFMLFPVISDVVGSPGGKISSPLYRPPWPCFIAYVSMPLKFVPQWILRRFFPSWPESLLQVVPRVLQSTAAIYASLTMADDIIKTVLELDVDFLREISDKLWFYYAESDIWISSEQREAVLRALSGTPAEVRVVYGRDIPHDFCLNPAHSAEVALQCVKWMNTGMFLGDISTT